jgi:hypothetical protein
MYAVLETLIARCIALGITLYPGNSVGYFGPLEARLRRTSTDRAHYFGCQAGVLGLGIESDGALKGCPSLGAESVGGRWRDHGLAALWSRSPEIWVQPRARGRLAVGAVRGLLLRAGVPRRVHVGERAAARAARQQPDVLPPGVRARPRGAARAARAGPRGAGRAVRPRAVPADPRVQGSGAARPGSGRCTSTSRGRRGAWSRPARGGRSSRRERPSGRARRRGGRGASAEGGLDVGRGGGGDEPTDERRLVVAGGDAGLQ